MKKNYTKQLLLALLMVVCGGAMAQTYSPTVEYNLRPKADGSDWDAKKEANSTNVNFEVNHNARFCAVQQYTIADIKKASSVTLSLKGASTHGTDALAIWVTSSAWTTSRSASDFNTLYQSTTGLLPANSGTAATTYLLKDKSSTKTDLENSNRECTFVISGAALETLKGQVSEDGTFTLLITNDKTTVEGNTNSKRQYYSRGHATESLRPTLSVTIPTAPADVAEWDLTTGWSTATNGANIAVNDSKLNLNVNSSNRCDVKSSASYYMGNNTLVYYDVTFDIPVVEGTIATFAANNMKLDGVENNKGYFAANGHLIVYFTQPTITYYNVKTPNFVMLATAASNITVHKIGSAKDLETLQNAYKYTLSVTSAGVATLTLPYQADIPSGMKVYQLKKKTDSSVSAEPESVIPSKKPVYVVAPQGNYELTPTAWTENSNISDQPEYGQLKGSYVKNCVPENNYILYNGTSGVGFYLSNNSTVGANKAYLKALTTSQAKSISIVFDEATPISDIEAVTADSHAAYNLSGQRVSKYAKGIVVINGRKYINK